MDWHCLLTDSRVVSTIGLLFDILGAVVLAWGLFVSKKEAFQLGGTYWMPSPDDDDDEFFKVPLISHFFVQSKRAKIGLGLLVLGFYLADYWRLGGIASGNLVPVQIHDRLDQPATLRRFAPWTAAGRTGGRGAGEGRPITSSPCVTRWVSGLLHAS